MKRLNVYLLLFLTVSACGPAKLITNDSATQTPIAVTLDLRQTRDDKVPVIVDAGNFTSDSAIYRLPRVIQGTYSVSDFGKYVEDFKAIDYEGNSMEVEQKDTNTWLITNAENLDKITYYVNDTYDIEMSGGIGGEEPFSPAGTNIEPDNYVLNLHGFVGYFEALKDHPYALSVTAPADFIRTSALEETSSNTSEDGSTVTTTYFAERYFEITDNPMMYGKLDVEEFMVGDIKIVLSVYSPNKVHSAASMKATIFKMMQAQKAYLGAINTTPRYDIYLYLSDGSDEAPKGFGALEHHRSTVVVLPEDSTKEELASSMIDVVAHEFFHIVTPLSVHSEDVHFFDYYAPTFSKHLWMYEGVTEYFAQHFQVYEGLVSPDEFYEVLNEKITYSKNMDDAMSFTIMSENVLKEPYASNYLNVYMKGALIGMCIDILMRKESNGQRSLLSLMKELSEKYGRYKPFNDDRLIPEITEMTYESVGNFLKTHVEGDVPINYDHFFEMVGLTSSDVTVETNYIFAGGQNIIFDADPQTGDIYFSSMALNNSFWASLGVQDGDIIKKVNGTALSLQNAQQVIGGMFAWQEGMAISMELERSGKLITISTKLTKPMATSKAVVEDANATEAQLRTRKSWLNG